MRLTAKRVAKDEYEHKKKNFNTYRGHWPQLKSNIKMPDRTQSGFPPSRE